VALLELMGLQAPNIGLAIHWSRVRVLDGHRCVVAFGKLLTLLCLCHQAA